MGVAAAVAEEEEVVEENEAAVAAAVIAAVVHRTRTRAPPGITSAVGDHDGEGRRINQCTV